ncbi:MAG: hypothetical protein ACJAZM_003100, partial [Cyclobacteriaceae bacterium]
LLTIAFVFSLTFVIAQESASPYTDWVKTNYPETHTRLEALITKVYGNDNEKKFNFLVEYQAKSLYSLFELLKEEKADWALFSTALSQWSQSELDQRGENWWEWPDTNWNKVESEYLFLLDTKSDN